MSSNTNGTAKKNRIRLIVSLAAVIILGWYFWGGGMDRQVKTDLQKINNNVAADAVEKYRIAEKGGDTMQMYTQAGMCAAAFLQAKDEENYKKWLDKEHQIGKSLGLPE